MRLIRLLSSAVLLAAPVASSAQDAFVEFASRDDRFSITFPGTPAISETTWTSEYGAVLPARVYSVSNRTGRHTVTVVDYNPVERVLLEKAKGCTSGAETCQGIADTGIGYWKNDIRGAVTYAIRGLLQRDVTVTHLTWNFMDMVAGQELQLTHRGDGARTFASAYMHANRLVVTESTVPKGGPPPLILQTLGWLDEQGRPIRYQYVYYNEPDPAVPPPPIRGRP
jgi:hypothetical protein